MSMAPIPGDRRRFSLRCPVSAVCEDGRIPIGPTLPTISETKRTLLACWIVLAGPPLHGAEAPPTLSGVLLPTPASAPPPTPRPSTASRANPRPRPRRSCRAAVIATHPHPDRRFPGTDSYSRRMLRSVIMSCHPMRTLGQRGVKWSPPGERHAEYRRSTQGASRTAWTQYQ